MALVLGGCASSGPAVPQVSARWDVRPETDSCGKLAGSLVLADVFGFKSPPDGPKFEDVVTAELERRCPEDTQPEVFDIDLFIPKSACAELRPLLDMALAFDMMVFVAPERRRMIDDLVASLEGEVERRCPDALPAPPSP